MTSISLTAAVLAVVSAVGAGAIAAYTSFLVRKSLRQTERNIDYTAERVELGQRRAQDELSTVLALIRAGSASGASNADALEKSFNRLTRAIADSGTPVPSELLPGQKIDSDKTNDVRILAEISHSLNTPLAQIDIAIERALAEFPETGREVGVGRSLRNARRSVDLCRSVLAAYRELHDASSRATRPWDISDLGGAVVAMILNYVSERQQYEPDFAITPHLAIEEGDLGYDNAFICAVLLPLVQNAVEHCVPAAYLSVEVTTVDGMLTISTSNSVEKYPDLTRLDSGDIYSTKASPHHGLGLSTVRTLTSRKSAGMQFEMVTPNIFRVRVSLEIAR